MAEVQETAEGVKKTHCSNCGAELRYKPGTTELTCDYCSTQNTIDESAIEIREKELHDYLSKGTEDAGTEKVTNVECESCGALNPFKGTSVGRTCLFCGGHLLMDSAKETEQIKPQALIPFQINHRDGIERYKKWLHSLWFAPNDLKKMQNLPDKLKGVYIPFWTFDADTFTIYQGKRGVNRTKTESYTVTVDGTTERRTRTKTVTDWYPASGQVKHFFDDELVLANTALPTDITMKLHPWNLKQLVPFDHDYLRGFLVESYNVNLDEGFEIGKQQITDQIRVLVKRDIGGDKQRIISMNTQWDNLTFKHILLPIYVSTYRYKGKVYRFLINGQSGEVRGERPYSFWKIFFLVLAILAVGGLLFMLFGSQGA